MTVVRRRLFWKIYLTLLASLVVAVALTGAFVWFLGEAFREGAPQVDMGPRDVSVYSAAGALTQSRGRAIGFGDVAAGHHWGPGHVLRIGLPDGNILLARFGPPSHGKRIRVLAAVLLAIALAVGLAAYPVTTLLTRRLERLRAGVARWGTRQAARLDDRGHDEVALLAATFNVAAARLDALLASQKALLANASHELRSPLARLRVAVEVADAGAARRDEIARNLAEMDVLVDELLLSSRLDHPEMRDDRREPIDLLGLAAEEAARVDAVVEGEPVEIAGDPVLLRRLIRNLLENGGKHGAPPVTIAVSREGDGAVVRVSDAGAGIAAGDRERIFEPFYRPAGSGEGAGGWGLGLALVRQIAVRHGGTVTCEATPSGSCFVVRLRG